MNEYLQSVSNAAVCAGGDAAASGPPLTPKADHDTAVLVSNLLEGNRRAVNYEGCWMMKSLVGVSVIWPVLSSIRCTQFPHRLASKRDTAYTEPRTIRSQRRQLLAAREM